MVEGKETEVAAVPTVGIILPPPELRNIVEKTAGFVAKNGMDFAERIRKEKEGEVKFNFLNPNNPYHAFFLHRVEEHKAGTASATAGGASKEDKKSDGRDEKEAEAADEMELRGPPPELQFLCDPQTLFQQDVDLVRLTAQFVARNGRDFLAKLIHQEMGNHQFDFLKPHHVLFTFFQKMVEQYSKIFLPTQEMKDKLAADASNPYQILDRARYSVEWRKREARERQAQDAEADAERQAFAQIDWHDFAVVQTIDFSSEDVDLPPPITVDQLAQRLLDMDRAEHGEAPLPHAPAAAAGGSGNDDQRGANGAAAAVAGGGSGAGKRDAGRDAAKNTADDEAMDVEMEMETEETSTATVTSAPPVTSAPSSAPPVRPPVNVGGELKIRKDYDPKAAHKAVSSGEIMQVSPLTGELIPASKMAEHMRIGLLDPRWREQKEKFEADIAKGEEFRTAGASAAISHLKDLASHRSDVFGSILKESALGQKAEDESLSSAAKLAALAAASAPAAEAIAPTVSMATSSAQGPNRPPGPFPPFPGQMPGQPPMGGPMGGPMMGGPFGPRPGFMPPQFMRPPMPGGPMQGPGAPPLPNPPQPSGSQPPNPSPSGPPTSGAPPGVPLPPRFPPPPPIGMGMGMGMGMGGMGGPPPGLPPAPRAMPPGLPPGFGMPPQGMVPPGPPRGPPFGMGPPGVPTPGMPPPGFGPPGGMFGANAAPPMPEPPAKRNKTDGLVSEEEFLQSHQGSVTLSILVTEADAKWNLAQGQTLTVTVQYTDKINDVKVRLQEQMGMPINKQRIMLDDVVLTNTNSVAFYNLTASSPLTLGSKTRGGRK